MREIERVQEDVQKLVLHQLKNYFLYFDEENIMSAIPQALQSMETNFMGLNNARLYNGNDISFNTNYSITWMIFLYRLSHELGTNPIYRKLGGGYQLRLMKYII